MPNPELPADTPEDSNGGHQSADFYRNLQQELLIRGDRQLPNEPNRGFEIVPLKDHEAESHEDEAETEPKPLQCLPLEEALPLKLGRTASPELREYAVSDLTQKLADGTVTIQNIPHVNRVRGGMLGLKLAFPITTSEYQAAVAEGRAEANLFDAEGRASGMDDRTQSLGALINPAEKYAIIHSEVQTRLTRPSMAYRDDLRDIPDEDQKKLPGLSQAFDFESGGNTTRLLNLSRTPVGLPYQRKLANVLRSYADKAGEPDFGEVKTVIVVPEDHRLVRREVERKDGGTRTAMWGAYVLGSTLIVSDRLLKPEEDKLPRPENRPEDSFFARFGLPGEPSEGPGSPKLSVGGEDWEATLAHELQHAALPKEYHDAVPLPKPAPTLYGREETKSGPHDEHLSELGAARYMGGEDALAVPADQREAEREIWWQYRGSDDGGVKFKKPLGPQFVTCRELDLSSGQLMPRLSNPTAPIPAEVTYYLVDDVQRAA